MLAFSNQTAYISEPLNVYHRPGVLITPTRYWYTYITADNEADYLPGLQQTLQFRYHTLAEIFSLRSLKDVGRMGRDWSIFMRGRLLKLRPLLKDPFAVFSAPWFRSRLGCQVIITVRHPAAFVSSLKRLNWPFNLNDLLNQPLLMRDWLDRPAASFEMSSRGAKKSRMDSGSDREEMERLAKDPTDVVGHNSLLWKMVYQTVAETCCGPQFAQNAAVVQTSPHKKPDAIARNEATPANAVARDEATPENVIARNEAIPTDESHPIVVRHEDLSLCPVEGFRVLYQTLGLDFTPEIQKKILASSSSENPKELSRRSAHSVRLDSQANLNNWKHRLTSAEITRIRQITEQTAASYYPESSWD